MLEPLGWSVAGFDGRNHFVLLGPNGATSTASASPSCWHTDRNMLAILRRLNATAVEKSADPQR